MAFQKGGITKVEYATDGPASPTWKLLAEDVLQEGLDLPIEETDQTDLADGQSANAQKRVPFNFRMADVDETEVSNVRTEAESNNRIWFRFTDIEGNTAEIPGTGSGQRGLIPHINESPLAGSSDLAYVEVSGEAVGPTHSDVMSVTRV